MDLRSCNLATFPPALEDLSIGPSGITHSLLFCFERFVSLTCSLPAG